MPRPHHDQLALVTSGVGLAVDGTGRYVQEIALGRLALVPVKGFPVMRQWYVVHRRDRSLPRIAEAFERFVVQEGARLIRGLRTRAQGKPR